MMDYRNLLSLEGRGFIVMGAGDGIGAQAAIALAQCGARVLCVDRDPGRAVAIAETVGGHALTADVTKRPDLEAVFDDATKRFGVVRGIINIVGMGRVKPLHEYSDEDIGAQFDIVLRHALLTLQLAGDAMREGGPITVVGSLSGDKAVPGTLVYGIAKAALHHLVRHGAVELGKKGIRVNGVAPGYIRTPRHVEMLPAGEWMKLAQVIPLGRAGEPHEIAAALLFLSSDLASHVSGHMMPVDGGLGIVAAVPELAYKTPA